jgi:ubiquitin-protein ligase E3 C
MWIDCCWLLRRMGYAGQLHKFCIMKESDDDSRLPSAATCFNALRLPNYSSEAQMQAKILTALVGSRGAEMED